MVLPTGFEVPPLPVLAVVLVAAVGVGYWLYRTGVPVTNRTILAFAPWMAVGSASYVSYQIGVWPRVVAAFFSSPLVYLTTFALAGGVWLVARRTDDLYRVLAGGGFVALSIPVGLALGYGTTQGGLTLFWPLVGLIAGAILAVVTWWSLGRVRPAAVQTTGSVGFLAVFGHALDATSTMVGVDVLGFGEQTPLSAAVLHAAAFVQQQLVGGVPLGVGWLFVLVKLLLVAAIVTLLADLVRDDPVEGRLLLGLVAAVGLGPGVHNVLLFIVSSPAGF